MHASCRVGMRSFYHMSAGGAILYDFRFILKENMVVCSPLQRVITSDRNTIYHDTNKICDDEISETGKIAESEETDVDEEIDGDMDTGTEAVTDADTEILEVKTAQ